jgi:hypothetical protein
MSLLSGIKQSMKTGYPTWTALWSFEMPGITHLMQRHIPDLTSQQHCSENLNSCTLSSLYSLAALNGVQVAVYVLHHVADKPHDCVD